MVWGVSKCYRVQIKSTHMQMKGKVTASFQAITVGNMHAHAHTRGCMKSIEMFKRVI